VLDARVPPEFGGWWLLVRIAKNQAGDGARLIKTLGGLTAECGLPRWTVIVGAESDLTNPDDALFHWMANTAPDRDRVTSVCGRRIAFDATPKMPGDEANGQPVREWPPLIAMSKAVKERVAGRWTEYGI
jgi:3-polyprenyl-4-hydroxybenzoate decarboxylase